MFILFLTGCFAVSIAIKINLSNILFLIFYFGANSELIMVKMNIIIINEELMKIIIILNIKFKLPFMEHCLPSKNWAKDNFM